MSLTSKQYGFDVEGAWVEIRGTTRAVHPEWTLVVNDEEVDSQRRTGEFTLTGRLPSGKTLTAHVDQGNFGNVDLLVTVDGTRIQKLSGFLL